MSQNALLRSVKGLGAPSTARKEDRKAKLKVAASATAESRQDFACKDHFAVRNGVRCAGVHLIVDLHGAKRLNDIDHIEATLRRCIEASRATLLHIHLHHFQPSGVSGVAVLAESHISIHTWPEAGYAALDIFMCGSAEPDNCIPVLREAFAAKRVDVNEILRGQDLRGQDLRGQDLRGQDLRGQDLRGQDLRGQDLRGQDLRGQDLRNQDD